MIIAPGEYALAYVTRGVGIERKPMKLPCFIPGENASFSGIHRS
jgi:hypothetical protein